MSSHAYSIEVGPDAEEQFKTLPEGTRRYVKTLLRSWAEVDSPKEGAENTLPPDKWLAIPDNGRARPGNMGGFWYELDHATRTKPPGIRDAARWVEALTACILAFPVCTDAIPEHLARRQHLNRRNRSWLLGLLCFGVLACVRAAPETTELRGPTVVSMNDLPAMAGPIESWNGGWLALSHEEGVMRVNVDAGALQPLRVAALTSILSLADAAGGPAWVLGRAEERLVLMRGRGEKFEEQLLPPVLPPSSKDWKLVADADLLVLVDSTHDVLHILQDGAWREQPMNSPEYGPFWDLKHAHLLLRGSTLYVGFDAGEWGGDLFAWSLARGEWTDPCPDSWPGLPVMSMVAGPEETIWVVGGLSHMGAAEGVLVRLDARGCSVVTSTGRSIRQSEVPWTLPSTAFQGVALDAAGRPHVLTLELGVVGLRDQAWKIETPGWAFHTSGFSFQTPDILFVFYPKTLGIQGDTALIGGGSPGVLAWKLGQPGPPRRWEVPRK